MKTSRYQLDPKGDVELILKYPNRQHFSWPEEFIIDPQIQQNSKNPVTLDSKLHFCPDELVITPQTKIRFGDPDSTTPRPKKKKKKGYRLKSTPIPEPILEPTPEPTPEPEASFGTEAIPEAIPEPEPSVELEPEPLAEPFSEPEDLIAEQAEILSSSEEYEEPHFQSLGYDQEYDEMRVRVSSRHLSLASPVFSKMLEGQSKEGIQNSQSFRRIETSEWDTEALLILLDIIHGHHRRVPRTVSLEMLGKIAVLVDYYDCHEIVEVFVDLWVPNMEKDLPTSYGKDSTIWLSISSVFSRAAIFEAMAKITVHACHGPMCTMELPIPHKLLDTIEGKRVTAITQMFQMLDDLRESLCNDDSCSDACSSMLLGSLIKQMHKLGLNEERPASPFLGYSVDDLKRLILGFQTPSWVTTPVYSFSSYHHHNLNPHSCGLTTKIEPRVKQIVEQLGGMRLGNWS